MILSATYDYVYSFGQWCATAIYLKKHGLRSHAGPFDWIGPTTELPAYFDTIGSDFANFMARENLRHFEDSTVEGTEHYEDRLTGWQTHHEFRIGVDFETNYSNYRKLLDRRIARFRQALESGKRVLLVHFHGAGRYERDLLCTGMAKLRAKYPRTKIDLLLLETENHQREISRETVAEGIVRITGDFYDRSRFNEVMGNEKLVSSVLRRIRMRGKLRNLVYLKLKSLKRRILRCCAKKTGECA